MAWPNSTALAITALDQSTDSPDAGRAQLLAAVQRLNDVQQSHVIRTTGGTGSEYTLDLVPAVTNMAGLNGVPIKCFIHSGNLGACTFSINGLTAVNAKLPDGSDPSAGQLPSGLLLEIVFDGTDVVLINSGKLNVHQLPVGIRYVPMSIPEVLSYNASAAGTWDVFSLDSILSGTGAVFAHLWIQNRSTTVGAPPESRGVYARAIAEGTATLSSPGELVGIQTTSDYHWGFRSRTIPLNALNQILLRTTWATIFPEADVLVIGYYV